MGISGVPRDGGPELNNTLKFSVRQPPVSVSFLQSYDARDQTRRRVRARDGPRVHRRELDGQRRLVEKHPRSGSKKEWLNSYQTHSAVDTLYTKFLKEIDARYGAATRVHLCSQVDGDFRRAKRRWAGA